MGKSTCRWPGCDNPAKTFGFCPRDYQRGKSIGNYEDPWKSWKPKRVRYSQCRWPECGEVKIHGRGLCKHHHRRASIVGDMEEPWKQWKPGGNCTICGKWSDGPKHGKRYCSNACNMLGWKRDNQDRVRELGREHARRRRAQIYATRVEKFTDVDIRLTHGDDCYLCGESINFKLKFPHPKSPSVDHVVPLSRGGSHTLDNVAMTHYVCNQRKNAQSLSIRPQQTLLAP